MYGPTDRQTDRQTEKFMYITYMWGLLTAQAHPNNYKDFMELYL